MPICNTQTPSNHLLPPHTHTYPSSCIFSGTLKLSLLHLAVISSRIKFLQCGWSSKTICDYCDGLSSSSHHLPLLQQPLNQSPLTQSLISLKCLSIPKRVTIWSGYIFLLLRTPSSAAESPKSLARSIHFSIIKPTLIYSLYINLLLKLYWNPCFFLQMAYVSTLLGFCCYPRMELPYFSIFQNPICLSIVNSATDSSFQQNHLTKISLLSSVILQHSFGLSVTPGWITDDFICVPPQGITWRQRLSLL